jgi:alkylation response protein AidB-like acyl-CoA dehydrogenase
MNFDADPSSEVALGRAETVCVDVLPNLPKEAGAFFRDADHALRAQGLFEGDSIEFAARVAMRLSAASGSLAVVFATGCTFARALEPQASPATGKNAGAPGGVLGVLELGASLTTRASGNLQLLVGEVPFVIGGPLATRAVVDAATDDGGRMLVEVDLGAPGVSRTPTTGLGFDSVPVCALRFDDVAVQPVITAHSSVASIRHLQNVRRVLDGSIGLGIGRHCFRIAVEHLRALGRRPSQSTEFSLSDVATELDAAELSLLRAAWEIDHGSSRALESASARLIATRAATRAAHTALVLTGNTDCTSDLRQCYLEACALEFRPETSAMQVATIASEMLEES